MCRKGEVGKEMYIIKSGKLDVIAEDGRQIFVTLTDGAVFGEVGKNQVEYKLVVKVFIVFFVPLYVVMYSALPKAVRGYAQCGSHANP